MAVTWGGDIGGAGDVNADDQGKLEPRMIPHS